MKSKFLKTPKPSVFRGKKMVKKDRKRVLFLMLLLVFSFLIIAMNLGAVSSWDNSGEVPDYYLSYLKIARVWSECEGIAPGLSLCYNEFIEDQSLYFDKWGGIDQYPNYWGKILGNNKQCFFFFGGHRTLCVGVRVDAENNPGLNLASSTTLYYPENKGTDKNCNQICKENKSDLCLGISATTGYGLDYRTYSRAMYYTTKPDSSGDTSGNCLSIMKSKENSNTGYPYFTYCYCLDNACKSGYGNCNQDAKDGCETNTQSDVNNCGDCGVRCASGLVCNKGECGIPESEKVVADPEPDCILDEVNGVYKCESFNLRSGGDKVSVSVDVSDLDKSSSSWQKYVNTNHEYGLRIFFSTIRVDKYGKSGDEDFYSTTPTKNCIYSESNDKKIKHFICDFSFDYSMFSPTVLKKLTGTYSRWEGSTLTPWNITKVKIIDENGDVLKVRGVYAEYNSANFIKGGNGFNITALPAPPSPECKILSASVDTRFCSGTKLSDGTKKCLEGDNLNITVKVIKEPSECLVRLNDKIEIDLSEDSGSGGWGGITGYPIFGDPGEECSMSISAPDTHLICNIFGDREICFGNATITNVAPECFNKLLNATYVGVYHQSELMGHMYGQFGNVTIVKPACNILSANITNNCPDNVCGIGQKITLNITVEDKNKCPNVNKMEIVGGSEAQGGITGLSILGMAAGGGIGGCSITMENSTRIQEVNGVYTSTWTIIGPIPEGCNGQKITAATAKLYNATSPFLIGSLSGSGVTGFFWFSYRELNKPMRAIINTTPNLEGNLDPFSEIKLQQLSIGDYNHWNWSYKSVDSLTWILYASDTHQIPLNKENVSIIFSQPPRNIYIGNYYINLTVWNETMQDSTKVKISLLSPGQGPLAKISSPLDDDLLTSREVTFDGTESTWPEYEDLFNMTWIFSDTKNKTVNASVSPKTIIYRYDKTLASPDPFTIKLNASGDHKYTMDTVNFYIGVCNEGTPTNPKWIFAGECSSTQPGFWCQCNPITCALTENCVKPCPCPDGKSCHMASGKCEAAQSMQTCKEYGSEKVCVTKDGCYWDKESSGTCKSCYSYGQRTITSCSNYNNDDSCNKDKCQLGISGADALLLMGQRTLINGEEYEVTQTQCSWNSTACILNATRSPVQYAPPAPPNVQCTYSTIIGACGSCNAGIFQGKLINYTLVPRTQENCGDSYESCARCGFTQERLPFFTPWQIIPFIFLIAIYYFFISKKKK